MATHEACCVDVRVLYTSKRNRRSSSTFRAAMMQYSSLILTPQRAICGPPPSPDVGLSCERSRVVLAVRLERPRVFEQFCELAPRLGQWQGRRLRAARGRRAHARAARRAALGLHTGGCTEGQRSIAVEQVESRRNRGLHGIVRNRVSGRWLCSACETGATRQQPVCASVLHDASAIIDRICASGKAAPGWAYAHSTD